MTARRIVVSAAACLAAAGIVLCQGGGAWPAPPPTPSAIVIVARPVGGCFSDTIRVTGFLVPREEALVTPLVFVPAMFTLMDDAARFTWNFGRRFISSKEALEHSAGSSTKPAVG
jgi:hypothetical protein